jgi:hypothetical protein
MIKESIFPYFGGKARVAEEVWQRFGKVEGYVEPFAGSLAMLLANPHPEYLKNETVNDLDCFIANFWRAAALFPDEVAAAADWPVNHVDMAARHRWLKSVRADVNQMIQDPDWCDPKIAGVWLWGICMWIGSGWCSDTSTTKSDSVGKRPALSNNGMGIHSLGQRPHLGNNGMGIHSLGQRPHLGDNGMGGYYELMQRVSQRLRFTRVCCADWSSLKSGVRGIAPENWGIFLDPPYTAESSRAADLYSVDCLSLGHQVAEWARELGSTGHKVALCGILKEYQMPDDWEVYGWDTSGFSYGDRDRQEVIWFSPACKASSAQVSLI